jgi:hypothetical protein
MISSDYQNLADFVAGFAKRREPLPPHACGRLAEALLDLAEQAKHLEQAPIRASRPVLVSCLDWQQDDPDAA